MADRNPGVISKAGGMSRCGLSGLEQAKMRFSRLFPRLFPFGMRKRWWLFRPIDLVVALTPGRSPKRGLLIVRMDGLGDMALFRRCLDHYPRVFGFAKEEITVLGCHSWRKLADVVFAGYRVVTIDEARFEKRFLYRLRTALWLKRQGFETAVCDIFFRKTLTADSLVHLSGAGERIVSLPYLSDKNRAEFAYFLARADRVVDTGAHPLHETLRHYNFLSQIKGERVPFEPPSLPWREQAPIVPQGAPYVLINFGSNEPGRKWPFERFLALARRVIGRGYRAVFAGGPREKAEAECLDAALAPEVAGGSAVNMIGRDTLPQLLDMIRHAYAVLTTETGPGHFACAMGTPTLMICGGGHDTTFVPFPPEIRPPTAHFVNYPMDCYFCLWSCPCRESPGDVFPCVEGISEDRVWAAFEKLVPARN